MIPWKECLFQEIRQFSGFQNDEYPALAKKALRMVIHFATSHLR